MEIITLYWKEGPCIELQSWQQNIVIRNMEDHQLYEITVTALSTL